MSLLLHAAEYKPETDGSDSDKKPISKISRVMERISNRKSTPRRPPPSTETTSSAFNDFPKPELSREPMSNISPIGDDEDTELGNFRVPDPKPRIKYNQDDGLNFSQELDDAYARKVVPPYEDTTTRNQPMPSFQPSSSDTIKKLDYIIHMIEEQQDHKTGRVAEELVLYSFLGIFVIFTIDSFVKVGRYTR